MAQIGYEGVRPIVDDYRRVLANQANGRWRQLESNLIRNVTANYPDIDLHQIRYATNINTLHGQAITIGYEIYFTEDVDIDSAEGMQLMLHELEHSAQYARRGGVEPFLSEYIAKIPGKIFEKRNFNVHDDIDLERAAIDKGQRSRKSIYGWDFKAVNECSSTLTFALDYMDLDRNWNTIGFWQIKPHKSIVLANGGRLHTKNHIFYVNAKTEDGLQWDGDLKKEINGTTLGFLKIDASGSDGGYYFEVDFSCD